MGLFDIFKKDKVDSNMKTSTRGELIKEINKKQEIPMMYYEDCVEAYKDIDGWQIVTFFLLVASNGLAFLKISQTK